MDPSDRSNWVRVWDNMNCRHRHELGSRQPAVSESDVRAASPVALAHWMCPMATEPDILPLAASRFWQQHVLERLAAAAAGSPHSAGVQFFLDQAHDSNVLAVRGLFEPGLLACRPVANWPPYATWVALELWRDERDGTRYMRVVNDNRVLHLPGSVGRQCDRSANDNPHRVMFRWGARARRTQSSSRWPALWSAWLAAWSATPMLAASQTEPDGPGQTCRSIYSPFGVKSPLVTCRWCPRATERPCTR
jgi:hypothetical protein